jgi:hypothetical protein
MDGSTGSFGAIGAIQGACISLEVEVSWISITQTLVLNAHVCSVSFDPNSEIIVSCISGVKNPIQVALQLAKEQMLGSSVLGRIPPMYSWKLIRILHFLPA